MAAFSEKLYKAHVLNLRAVETALESILRELNSCIARGDHKTEVALTKTAMLLLGAWAENRLRKVCFEPNGFSQVERDTIQRCASQLDSWKSALETGFRKRYALPNADLSVSLPITARSRYQILTNVIDQELRPIIEVRNKLAHGQWARTLTSNNEDFSPDMMALISRENALSIKCKRRILAYLAQIIHDLVAGSAAFERDFESHFTNLEHAKREILNRDFDIWARSMRSKYQQGRNARLASTQNFEPAV